MRDSNTFIYIVGGIIVLHFVVGFIWLIYKFSKKDDKK
jgi:heme/copper-type cytochrome/quinol oxidase subunit 4